MTELRLGIFGELNYKDWKAKYYTLTPSYSLLARFDGSAIKYFTVSVAEVEADITLLINRLDIASDDERVMWEAMITVVKSGLEKLKAKLLSTQAQLKKDMTPTTYGYTDDPCEACENIEAKQKERDEFTAWQLSIKARVRNGEHPTYYHPTHGEREMTYLEGLPVGYIHPDGTHWDFIRDGWCLFETNESFEARNKRRE